VDPIRQLANDIFWDKVRRARETPPVEKLLLGPRLFDFACGITRSGIRHQHPDADEAEVERILADRLALQRRLERRR
jgi:Rv0078B-related antitoxin